MHKASLISQYSELATAALRCITFHPSGYSYLHLAGHVTWKDNKSTPYGTIGVLKEGLGGDIDYK